MHTRVTRLVTVAIAALLAAAPVLAQTYPVRPVRIMVGASPGGGTDIIARMLAEKFGDAFKQSFVVENRPGASNTIAGEAFTMLTGTSAVHVPYKGSSQAHTDLITGRVQIMLDTTSSAMPQIRAGKLRPLAVMTPKRSAELPSVPTLVPYEWIADAELEVGRATPASGRAVLASLKCAADAARAGTIDGILFAPLNKHAMRLAGLAQEDEMRFLQHVLGVAGFVTEFNITGPLWTSRVTSHIPLSAVAAAITGDGVRDAVRIIDRSLRAAGVARPRIAVAGLNPHAGDGGSFGREEIDIIAPAVRSLAADGLDVRGPYPADTVFVAARRGDFDAVVTMYHDQGQIAMKLLGFEQGVTLLGGLPVPVATCASGTAFDIAGEEIAGVEGLQQAFDLVVRMSAAGLALASRAAEPSCA